jgi:AraC family L-rhamnose operon transcriptional activator RhaR/AraC family L-rhamnose operon regulatory protein RhaS
MCSTARSLQRHFKAETGQSIMQYLLRLRLLNAERLLRETNYKAEEIAQRCGFSDCTYFNRQFTRIIGIPPGQYRRRERTGNPKT